ncbi:MAG: pyridoxamine 5'-phosphate oxidase family protein [Candidatus Brocadiae bacterium]|nr:pyridoxamine 5'-phosphate oxidase family protein [Candidatus Brocadiia bacterium]
MDHLQMFYKITKMLEEVRTGVLSSLDKNGKPHMRWLTPAILKGRPGAIYAVSCPKFDWVQSIYEKPCVEWMIQKPSLNEIMRIKGQMRILDNPSLKAEILQEIASRLVVFWKINTSSTDFVVLETVVEEASHFLPMQGIQTIVKFPVL